MTGVGGVWSAAGFLRSQQELSARHSFDVCGTGQALAPLAAQSGIERSIGLDGMQGMSEGVLCAEAAAQWGKDGGLIVDDVGEQAAESGPLHGSEVRRLPFHVGGIDSGLLLGV